MTNKAFKADHEIAPMAKNCIKFVLKILKRVISTYFFYHFWVLIFESNLTFKTRLILGFLDQDQITLIGLDFKTIWEDFWINIEKKFKFLSRNSWNLSSILNVVVIHSKFSFLRKYVFWVSSVKCRKWQQRLMIKQTRI